MKRSPLKRKTGLKRGGPIKQSSVKMRAKRAAWARVRQQLVDAGRTRCEACDVHYLASCNGVYEETHHMQLRSQGGANTIENALPVSAAHHNFIHANPLTAKALGLIRTVEVTA